MTLVNVFLHQALALAARVSPKDVIDVTVVGFVLYQILKLVRGTRAAELMVGLVVLAVVGLIANFTDLILLKWLFSNLAPFVVFGILVLFQPELRRALDQVGRLSHINLGLAHVTGRAYDRGATEAIRAAERLSARKTGALLVFEREVGLEDYASTGVRINSEGFTAEFLQTIFFNGSPLHDGAAIIRGNAIVAAGCILPIPAEGELRGVERLGTRHRAALGLSMVSDAVVLIVSEETGLISLAEDGKITRGVSPEALKLRLQRPDQPTRSSGRAAAMRFLPGSLKR